MWPFAARYAAHQLNLWPRVSLPETSPTLRWTGKVGDASVFRVWGCRAFVCDSSAEKLFARAIPCIFLGFPPDALGWQFYHPTSRRVLSSQDVTFDNSVPFYHLFPYRSAPPPPPPLFLAPSPPPVDPLPGTVPVEVAGDAGAARDTASGGAESGGAEPGGAESEGAGSRGAEPGGAKPEGTLSSQQLREWLVRHARLRSGAADAGGAGATAAAGGIGGTASTGPGVARTRRTGAAGTGTGDGDTAARGAEAGDPGTGGTGAGGARVSDPGAVDAGAGGASDTGAGGIMRPQPFFVPLLQQVLCVPSSTNLNPPLLSPSPDRSQPLLRPASPLPIPSPYTKQSSGLTERHERASRLVSPVRTACRVPRLRPPPVPGTHAMALRPSSVALRSLVSSLLLSAVAFALVAELLDFAAVCRLDYAIALVAESKSASPPSVGGECALGTDVLGDKHEDFECLAAAVPRFTTMLLAPEGDLDAPDIPTLRSYAEAIMGSYSSQWQAAMVAEMASWKSTGTYVDAVPPSGANIVDGMWIFREKWPSGSPLAFKECYVARGFKQRQGFDFYQAFSPTSKMTTLRVLLHVAGQRDYELHSLDFSTAFLQGSLHEEIWLRRPPGLTDHFLQKRHTCTDLGELRSYLGLQITRDRARRTITLTQSHMVHQVLQRFGFQFSLPQPTPLSTGHSLSALPLDESVEPSGPYLELVGCLMNLMTCTRPHLAYPLSLLALYMAPGRHRKMHWDAVKRVLRYLCTTSSMGLVLRGRGPVVLTAHVDASWVDDSATQRSSQGYTFSLGSGSISRRSTRLSSVLSSSCEAEIYAGAMAAQDLR
ncbi:unnamed protein product [Closterium sp. NIES-54]